MRKIVVLSVFLAVFFNGCSIKPDTQTIKTYQLGAIKYNPVENLNSTCSDESLQIKYFTGAVGAYSTKIFYSKEDGELSSYRYSFWVETPFKAIKRAIANRLIDENIFKDINESAFATNEKYILESKIVAFEHILKDNNSYINFGIAFKLIEKNGNTVTNKKIYLQKQAKTNDAKGAVGAFNEALEEMNEKVAIWIKESACDNK